MTEVESVDWIKFLYNILLYLPFLLMITLGTTQMTYYFLNSINIPLDKKIKRKILCYIFLVLTNLSILFWYLSSFHSRAHP